jgi:hypothetical protein
MNNAMPESRTDLARRITREIEDALFHHYHGEGLLDALAFLGALPPDARSGRMFIELPYAIQWKELNERVNWAGLTAAERYQVMARVLDDVRENVPEEIYPATWFDGIIISVDQNAKVFDLAEVKRQIDTPDRTQNLDERVCAPERSLPTVKKPVPA